MWGNLFWVTAVLGTVSALFNTLSANIYDIKQAQLRRQQALHPHSRRYRRRPLVSVIILTKNNQKEIISSLSSLVSNSYRKMEVIVVDQASTDATAKIVRQFINEHPKKHIRLCAQRRQGVKNQPPLYALKKYAAGELTMVLEQPLTFDKQALAKAVDHFNSAEYDLLTANYKIAHSYSTAGLFQEFWLLIRSRTQKAYDNLNSAYVLNEPALIGSALAMKQWLQKKQLNELSVSYASDVVFYAPALSFSRFAAVYYKQQIRRLSAYMSVKPVDRNIRQALPVLVSLISTVVALMAPVLLTYFSYLAIRLHQPDFLVISWVALAIFLVFVIWEDEQLKLRQKIKYVLLIPITYIWFYAISAVHYVVALTSFRAFTLN